MFRNMTRTTHRWAALGLGVVCAAATPFLAMRVLPDYLGVVLFVLVVFWIAVGITASKSPAWSTERRSKSPNHSPRT